MALIAVLPFMQLKQKVLIRIQYSSLVTTDKWHTRRLHENGIGMTTILRRYKIWNYESVWETENLTRNLFNNKLEGEWPLLKCDLGLEQ